MDSIGERLRQERVRRGFDLVEIAERTKINLGMLEAIEADDLDRLPGTFFTRSFVRQYARALGLDEDEFEPELKRLTLEPEEPSGPPQPSRPEARFTPAARDLGPGRNHSLGALIAFVVILAACSGIYVLWQKTRAQGDQGGASTERVVREVRSLPPERNEPAPGQPAPAQQPSPAPGEPASGPPMNAPPAALPPALPESAALARSSVPPGGKAGVKVDLLAKGSEVWVRVIGDRKALFEGNLKPGQQMRAEAVGYIRVRYGRPESLAISWNGQAITDTGKPGEAETMEFSPERFRVVPPAPKLPDETTYAP